MDFSDSFRIVNLVVGVIMILGGISQFFNASIQSIVIGVYVIIFGACVGLLEFQIPPQVSRYASFMFSFIGRGICTCIPRSVISHLRLVILRYILLPSRSVLTRRSLHLYRLHSALQPLDALRSRLHHRADRHCIHCSGVCALD